ncbi:hypothetical protein ACFL3T_00380 [Patescibacteria group bacterium]
MSNGQPDQEFHSSFYDSPEELEEVLHGPAELEIHLGDNGELDVVLPKESRLLLTEYAANETMDSKEVAVKIKKELDKCGGEREKRAVLGAIDDFLFEIASTVLIGVDLSDLRAETFRLAKDLYLEIAALDKTEVEDAVDEVGGLAAKVSQPE